MSNNIKILEAKQGLLKVKYRGEFGYFFPSTKLVKNDAKIKSFNDAKKELLEKLKLSNAIFAPTEFDIDNQLFIIQVINRDFKNYGIFIVDSLGKIKEVID
ncbi:hypothetical protein [Apilactobacillus quenuiae]|uniref:hypothetical protein n=1 Tax=Apilactobacillus quenuiae TaxID=2008377 RepID=UPI000D014E9D|nr:hypothetical protein [Apilactobacillus quenuiae]